MFKFFKNLFSKKTAKTRMVKAKDGLNVELHGDWPDGMADVISNCLKSNGEIVSATIDDRGNVKLEGDSK